MLKGSFRIYLVSGYPADELIGFTDSATAIKVANIVDGGVNVVECFRTKRRKPPELSDFKKLRREKWLSSDYIALGNSMSFSRKNCKVCGKELKAFNETSNKSRHVSRVNRFVDYCSASCKRKDLK